MVFEMLKVSQEGAVLFVEKRAILSERPHLRVGGRKRTDGFSAANEWKRTSTSA
jgi:hypothetical protein